MPETILPPIHPGEILREEFLVPMGLSAGVVARRIGVPRSRIERLVAEQVDLSVDTALRLSRLFGNSAEFWLSLQTRYALDMARADRAADIEAIEPLKLAS